MQGMPHLVLPPISSLMTTPTPALVPSFVPNAATTSCSRCGRTDTPLWRRDTEGRSICNACGLAAKSRGLSPHASAPPPTASSSTAASSSAPAAAPINDAPKGSCPGDGFCNGTGGRACCQGCPAFNNRNNRINAFAEPPKVEETTDATDVEDLGGIQCDNCGTRTTPLWRRDGEGKVACNACGLYWKLHGKQRPVGLNKPTIKRRKRVAPLNGPMAGRWPGQDANGYYISESALDYTNGGGGNGDPHDAKKQRISVPPHDSSPEASQGQHSPIDPMAELAEAASRLEPLELPAVSTTPQRGYIPLPTSAPTVATPQQQQQQQQHPHAAHPHHHHHHHHHHHPRPIPAAVPMATTASSTAAGEGADPPSIDSLDDLRAFREILCDDVSRARSELEHIRATVSKGERVLELLDQAILERSSSAAPTKIAPRTDLDRWLAEPAINDAAHVPLGKRKSQPEVNGMMTAANQQ